MNRRHASQGETQFDLGGLGLIDRITARWDSIAPGDQARGINQQSFPGPSFIPDECEPWHGAADYRSLNRGEKCGEPYRKIESVLERELPDEVIKPILCLNRFGFTGLGWKLPNPA